MKLNRRELLHGAGFALAASPTSVAMEIEAAGNGPAADWMRICAH